MTHDADSTLKVSDPHLPTGEPLLSDSALRAILTSLGTAPSFRDCMRQCALTLHQCTHADGATIYRLSSGDQTLEQIHSVGFPRRLAELSQTISLENSLTGRAILQRELIVSTCVALDERIPRQFRDELVAGRIRTLVVLPLLMHAEVVGAITLGWQKQLKLQEQDREVLMNIGYGIAIAVEHDLREFESTRDGLTGLLNRRSFDQHLKDLARACAASGTSFCLVIMDLDDFKACNDTFGHLVGDQVLRETAKTLTQELLLERAIPFRVGGEEFVVLLPNTDAAQATQLSQRIGRAVSAQRFKGDNGSMFSVSLSAGVAQYNPHHGLDALYSRADKALYQAKQAGKNRVINAETGAVDG